MPSSRMLILLDGSTRAEAILPHALTLARLMVSDLTLLRVIMPPQHYGDTPPLISDHWYDDEQAWSQDYLTATAQRLKGEGVAIQTETLYGDAGGSIISYIQRHPDIHMVALATRGRGNVGRWILGSVAEQVMHAVTTPLLLLHPVEQVSLETHSIASVVYHRMIVPLDGTARDEHALEYVQAFAPPSQAEVILVAISPSSNNENDLDDEQKAPGVENARQQMQRAASYLLQKAQQLRSTTGLTVDTELAIGDSETWVERLTQNHSDILIITPHRHHSDRLVLRFLHHMNIPVLLVL